MELWSGWLSRRRRPRKELDSHQALREDRHREQGIDAGRALLLASKHFGP